MGKVKIVQNGAMFEISDDLRFIRVNKTGSDHVKLGPRAGNNPSTRFSSQFICAYPVLLVNRL